MALLTQPAFAQGNAAAGFARVKPSLVKVWALDQSEGPIDSGTGFVVANDGNGSVVLTAGHVVAHATTVIVNVPGQARDLVASVEKLGPSDAALLHISERNLRAVTFAPPNERLREGSSVAIAGFFKNDDMIEISGLAPRVLGSGTIGALANDGRFINIANVHVEDGLSGGPAFDPQTGEVVGMVDTSADSGESGGYAVSGPVVLSAFFDAQGVQVAYGGGAPLPPPPVAYAPPPSFGPPQGSMEPAEPAPMSQEPPGWQSMPPPQPQIPSYAYAPAQYNSFGAMLIGRGIGVALIQGQRGVWVRQVAPFGAARRAGISGGDLLVAVNGQQIVSAAQVNQMLASSPPGTPVMVAVERQGVTRVA
ncbi:MAG: trypsin-like peptidase domain-containing protein, partial [Candidatus Eremiobacteraeota bacterium]|nr:trypsin-like peptidase domain-containing protein [Candidatus Eremiobacteraeota bacterium]